MAYIHELADWPEFRWDSDALAAPLAAVRHRQGKLLGHMLALGFELQEEAGLAALTDEVVGTSAIEGERLNPDEVRSSLARRLGLETAGLPSPGRDVEGVVQMLLDATREFESALTDERLFGWHAALFPTGRSGMVRIPVGVWRTDEDGPMQVVSGPAGREAVHFEAPDAGRLAVEMSRFLRWFNAKSDLDPVLRAAVAHFWFVTIHPFADGNGRIARAIADMALARADGTASRFYSVSAALEARRQDYYWQLESSQRGSLDITSWLAWFLRSLDETLGRAEVSLAGVMRKAAVWRRANVHPLNDRQGGVLNRLLGDFEGHLTTSKYAKLAKCSRDTALRDIKALVQWGVLVANPGGGRSTSYRLVEPVKDQP